MKFGQLMIDKTNRLWGRFDVYDFINQFLYSAANVIQYLPNEKQLVFSQYRNNQDENYIFVDRWLQKKYSIVDDESINSYAKKLKEEIQKYNKETTKTKQQLKQQILLSKEKEIEIEIESNNVTQELHPLQLALKLCKDVQPAELIEQIKTLEENIYKIQLTLSFQQNQTKSYEHELRTIILDNKEMKKNYASCQYRIDLHFNGKGVINE